MNTEVENLKLEINILKKRIEILEGIERRRKISKIIKIIIYIIVIGALVFFGLKVYERINDYYNNLNNLISNPFQSFL